jgi:hypothetical protein
MTSSNDTAIETFRANDGVIGGHFEGKTTLILHTPGRKSGKQFVNPRRYPGFAEYERQTAGVRTIPVLELMRA